MPNLNEGMLCSIPRRGYGNLVNWDYIDIRIYGSWLAVLCVSRTETFAMHRKATGFSHFLAQSLCGKRPHSLPGNQSMKRAAFSKHAD